ncbi:hypothetical protein HanXRQr2_Chr11g0474161 [Helianthus annuus]|uniref:Uncharacterized protein n=1 Tax=Helianthus annuus TaxID=4232 RepID=A0A9K3MYR8_HELAN|nr:hypothetical protein HanXRQr2_Chr11g0474161 [Helianthus annuus]
MPSNHRTTQLPPKVPSNRRTIKLLHHPTPSHHHVVPSLIPCCGTTIGIVPWNHPTIFW